MCVPGWAGVRAASSPPSGTRGPPRPSPGAPSRLPGAGYPPPPLTSPKDPGVLTPGAHGAGAKRSSAGAERRRGVTGRGGRGLGEEGGAVGARLASHWPEAAEGGKAGGASRNWAERRRDGAVIGRA